MAEKSKNTQHISLRVPLKELSVIDTYAARRGRPLSRPSRAPLRAPGHRRRDGREAGDEIRPRGPRRNALEGHREPARKRAATSAASAASARIERAEEAPVVENI